MVGITPTGVRASSNPDYARVRWAAPSGTAKQNTPHLLGSDDRIAPSSRQLYLRCRYC